MVEEQPVTMVRIKKERDPLVNGISAVSLPHNYYTLLLQGATVKTSKDGSVLISRILCGGAADKSGE